MTDTNRWSLPPRAVDPDALAFEIGNAAYAVISEQFEAADVHTGQHGDRPTRVDDGHPLRGEVHIEIDLAARDRLVDPAIDAPSGIGCR